MSVVIKIENVSKQYRLGLIGTNTLKGDLQSWWYRIRGLPDPTLMIGQENKLSAPRPTPHAPHPGDFIWGSKEISFEVQHWGTMYIVIQRKIKFEFCIFANICDKCRKYSES